MELSNVANGHLYPPTCLTNKNVDRIKICPPVTTTTLGDCFKEGTRRMSAKLDPGSILTGARPAFAKVAVGNKNLESQLIKSSTPSTFQGPMTVEYTITDAALNPTNLTELNMALMQLQGRMADLEAAHKAELARLRSRVSILEAIWTVKRPEHAQPRAQGGPLGPL